MRSGKWNLQSTLWEELWAHRLLKHVTLLETSSIPSRKLPIMVWRTHMPTHREERLQTQLIYPLKVLSKLLPQNFFKTLVVRTLSLVDPLLHHMLMQTIMRQDKPAAWLLAIKYRHFRDFSYQNRTYTGMWECFKSRLVPWSICGTRTWGLRFLKVHGPKHTCSRRSLRSTKLPVAA